MPAEKYDDVLLPFLALMRRELHANCRKGDRPGWLAMDANTALLEVYWHTAKLSAAVKNNDGPAIQEHAADVANMSMMVLDVCGGLAFVEDATPSAGVQRLVAAAQAVLDHRYQMGAPTLPIHNELASAIAASGISGATEPAGKGGEVDRG